MKKTEAKLNTDKETKTDTAVQSKELEETKPVKPKLGMVERATRSMIKGLFNPKTFGRFDISNDVLCDKLHVSKRTARKLVVAMGFEFSPAEQRYIEKTEIPLEEKVDYVLDHLNGRQIDALRSLIVELKSKSKPKRRKVRSRGKFKHGYNVGKEEVEKIQAQDQEIMGKVLNQFAQTGLTAPATQAPEVVPKVSQIKRRDAKGYTTKEWLETQSVEQLKERLGRINQLINADPKPNEKWLHEKALIERMIG